MEKFGNTSIIDDTDLNGVEMIVKFKKRIQFHLNFAILTDVSLIDRENIPQKRIQFRLAAEKYLSPILDKMANKSKLDPLEPFMSCEF